MTYNDDLEQLQLIYNFGSAGHTLTLQPLQLAAINDAISAIKTLQDLESNSDNPDDIINEHINLKALREVANYNCDNTKYCIDCKYFNDATTSCISGLALAALKNIEVVQSKLNTLTRTVNENKC